MFATENSISKLLKVTSINAKIFSQKSTITLMVQNNLLCQASLKASLNNLLPTSKIKALFYRIR